MVPQDASWLVWLPAAALLLVAVWLGSRLQRGLHALRQARKGRAHQRAGEASEAAAARWLRECGYTVIEGQPSAHYELEVEGTPRSVEIRADLRVSDGQREWVVEVKTGERGSRVGFRGTRRQLLEYQLAFGTEGVLLVDPTRGILQRVRFPFPGRPLDRDSAGTGRWAAQVLVVAALIAFVWAWAAR